MIKFFRKIRYNLMETGKTGSSGYGSRSGKYFKYAIGEIILVVIGILIALSINNWNEERKAAENTMLLFKQVHKELETNINRTNNIINIYRRKDSIAYKVINKKVSREEFRQNPSSYLSLLTFGIETNIVDEAFKNLINGKGNTSQVQDAFILKLKGLHGVNKNEIDMMDAKLGTYIFGLIDKYKEEQEWYYEYFNFKTVTDAMLDYFLIDPAYLNEVTFYKTAWLGEHAIDNINFRHQAITYYEELSDYLNIPTDTSLIRDVNNYEHYIGTYIEENSNFIHKIIRRNNHLVWTWKHKTDATRFGEINFYPDSKNHFTINESFGKLLFDENNEVTGFIRTRLLTKREFKKID